MSDLIGQISSRSTLVGVQERGSNTNGEYLKYKDGTLICTIKDKTSNSSAAVTWTFPVAFASGSEPTVAGSTGADGERWSLSSGGTAISNTSWNFCCALLSVSVGSWGGTVGYSGTTNNLSAIGRWY